MIKADNSTKENQVRITEGLFSDFLCHKLKLTADMHSLHSFNDTVAHIGNNDPNGVLRILNAFLTGIKVRSKSL